jgi:sugar transferase (PEP-CTERM/EpsH1 system associated)
MLDDKNDIKYIKKLSPFVEDIYYDVINPRWKKICSAIAFATFRPISVPYFYSKSLQQSVDRLIDKQTIETVFCFSSPTAEYIFRSKFYQGKLRKAKWIMDFVDVDSDKWKQYSERCNFPMNWVYNLEAKYLLNYEERISKEFQHVLFVSEAEKSLFGQYVSTSNVHAVGNGVDFNFFSPLYRTTIPKNGPVIVFTGVMDYLPNVDGVKWFANEVFPLILNNIPELIFYIVGSNPSSEIKSLSSLNGVVVTGFVDDVRDYLAIADVCVVPLRIARGVQNKVLEAMAMGKATVCTPNALEGIEVILEKDLLLAKDEKSFAASVTKLLLDRPYREEIGKCARQSIEKVYSWKNNLDKLACLLNT